MFLVQLIVKCRNIGLIAWFKTTFKKVFINVQKHILCFHFPLRFPCTGIISRRGINQTNAKMFLILGMRRSPFEL